jgi:hypothetical protein
LTGSTPNLLVDITDEALKPTNNEDVLRYERDKMLSLREQVQTQLNTWMDASTNNADDSKADQLPFKPKGGEADLPKTTS